MSKSAGFGGVVRYGYATAARVGRWEYAPEPDTQGCPPGTGTITVELFEVSPVWTAVTDKFELELRGTRGGALCWPDAEMISESCFAVGALPTIRK